MLTWIVTGALGHLGSTIIRLLENTDCQVRGLILEGQEAVSHGNIQYIKGDVTKADTLRPLFENIDPQNTIVIHTAGLIDIGDKPFSLLHKVNVGGTENIVRACSDCGVRRLVHVSSVHALNENHSGDIITEQDAFFPDELVGNYAKTKAEASQLVLDEVQKGLDGVIVHPSGILGPYDVAGNHLVQVIRDYMLGKLPACVQGGYDMVDVRDVAEGCILAALRGQKGHCYILSNRYMTIKELLSMAGTQCRGKALKALPLWLAKAAAPFLTLHAKIRHRRPLYTAYSLYALSTGSRFSYQAAQRDLGYSPRSLSETVFDTVGWLKMQGIVPKGKPAKVRRKKLRSAKRRVFDSH